MQLNSVTFTTGDKWFKYILYMVNISCVGGTSIFDCCSFLVGQKEVICKQTMTDQWRKGAPK